MKKESAKKVAVKKLRAKTHVTVSIGGGKENRTKEGEALILQAIKGAVHSHLFGNNAHIDVHMVSKDEIREINALQRGKDSVTDVLSFPANEMKDGKPVGGMPLVRDFSRGEIMLGDMIICYDKVLEQGEEYGHGASRECFYLALHSALHLLGFDHENEDDKKIMRAEEERIYNIYA